MSHLVIFLVEHFLPQASDIPFELPLFYVSRRKRSSCVKKEKRDLLDLHTLNLDISLKGQTRNQMITPLCFFVSPVCAEYAAILFFQLHSFFDLAS